MVSSKNSDSVRRRPAKTPEAREKQLIAAAVDLAEKQILDGTASSQVLTHYLKLGSVRNRAETEKIELEKELVQAKVDQIRSGARVEELYEAALHAMRRYQGNPQVDD